MEEIAVPDFNENTVGVIPRRIKSEVINKNIHVINSNLSITADDNDEYTITIFPFHAEQRIYDNNHKIMECSYLENGKLNIQIFTDKQVNLYIECNIKSLLINSKAPLFLGSKIKTVGEIGIIAKALILDEEVKTDNSLSLLIEQGLAFFGNIDVKNLIVNAYYIYNDTNITLGGQFDVVAEYYKQTHKSQTYVDSLRFIAKSVQIIGNLKTFSSSFLAVNKMIFGDNESFTLLKFLGNNYITLGDLLTQGETQIVIDTTINNLKSHVFINRNFVANKKTILDIIKTNLFIKQIDNKGEIKLIQSSLKTDNVFQDGIFDSEQSQLEMTKLFFGKRALSEFNDTDLNCNFFRSNGFIIIKNCNYFGKLLEIYNGKLEILKNSSININENLFCDTKSEIVFQQSSINAMHTKILGKITCHNTDMQAIFLNLVHIENSIINSKIHAYESLKIMHGGQLSSTKLHSKNIMFNGNYTLNEMDLYADHLTFKSLSTNASDVYLYTNILNLNGGIFQDQVIFKKSFFTAKTFLIDGKINFEQSIFYGIDQNIISHEILGNLTLSDSKFITDSYVDIHSDGALQLFNFSRLKANLLHFNGTIESINSSIFCKTFLQEKATFQAQSSHIEIIEKFLSKESNTELNHETTLKTPAITLNQNDNFEILDKSVLHTDKLVSLPTTFMKSKNSNCNIQEFLSMGNTEIFSGILTTENLVIYNQFALDDSAYLLTKQLIEISKSGSILVRNSNVISRDVLSRGETLLDNSAINAQKNAEFLPSSTITIQGNGQILAKNLSIAGQVNIKEQARDELALESNESNAIFYAKQLKMSDSAKINGKGNLVIESQKFDNSGSIELMGLMRAKGGLFTNSGSIKSENLEFGFDYAVYNDGLFSSKNLVLNSNFINFFGRVYVEQSFAESGFVRANLGGFIAANNYNSNSLLSLNAGLIVPNFSADYQYIFSLGNLVSAAKIISTTCFPTYTNVINAAFMVPNLINTGYGIYKNLNQFNWDTVSRIRAHELMPLVCSVKNAAMFGMNAVSTSFGTVSELSNIGNDLCSLSKNIFDANNYNLANITSFGSKINWKNIGIYSATPFLANYSNNSLFSFNSGITFIPSTAKNSIFDINSGFEYSLLSHNVNTNYLYNYGYSNGTNASFMAHSIDNTGIIGGANQLMIKAEQMNNWGYTYGANANVFINSLQQNGYFSLSYGQANINAFEDCESSETQFEEVYVVGDSFNSNGQLNAKKTQFIYDEKFSTAKNGIFLADDVCIKTKYFEHNSQLDYQNHFIVETEKASLNEQSIINGKKTAEDQLFTKKSNDTAQENTDTNNQNESEDSAAKCTDEFNPVNIFNLKANEVELNGQLTGGDYTIIQGVANETDNETDKNDSTVNKCKSLEIGCNANIDLEHGIIASEKVNIYGKGKFTDFNLDIDKTNVAKDGYLGLTKSAMSGASLESDGTLVFDTVNVAVKSVNFSDQANEQFNDTLFNSEKVSDSSQLNYHGTTIITTNEYEHGGQISDISQDHNEDNIFYVKTNSMDLHGGGNFKNAVFDALNFGHETEFLEGINSYNKYQFEDSLSVVTESSIAFNHQITRDCNITLKAKDIMMTQGYNKGKELTFISTQADVVLSNQINASQLIVNSARNVFNSSNIQTGGVVIFDAKSNFKNSGTIVGESVSVTAANIQNFAIKDPKQSNTGIISATKNLFLEATTGDIENYGGLIQAGEYTQLIAAGNVKNVCNSTKSQGKFDVITQYDGGIIRGGTGQDTDGIGLYIKAGDKIISQGADFKSQGSNYFEADKGFDFTAKQHTYISDRWESKKWYRTKVHIETSTVVKGSTIYSDTGQNILISEHGGLNSVASAFISPGGTKVYTRDDIKLYSLKSQNKVYESKSILWGLCKETYDEIHQDATPTLFVDNGVTKLVSKEGNIDARGAYIIGGGDLYMKAAKRIKFGVDILDHTINKSSKNLSFKIPFFNEFNAMGKNKTSFASPTDSTYSNFNNLFHSNNATEVVANTVNTGIDLYNTTNDALRGVANNSIMQELLARYGLCDLSSLNVSVTRTETNSTNEYQTVSYGGVDRGGDVYIDAGEGVDLENGVRVHADGNMDVNAPEIIATAAELNSKFKEKTNSESISFNHNGIQNASASYSKDTITGKTYVNAELSSNGKMKLHYNDEALNSVILDGANIIADKLEADINKLQIIDKQDCYKTTNQSFSAALDGQMSYYDGIGHSEKVTKHSGICANETNLHVSDAFMKGGEIITEDDSTVTIDKLTTQTLSDSEEYNGIGISFNVNDLKRLTGEKPTNQVQEKAIATIEVNIDKVNYQAQQNSVLFTKDASQVVINELHGQVHTESANGVDVKVDENLHIKLDIPVTNKDYLQQSKKNIQSGYSKIIEALSSDSVPEIPDKNNSQPFLPSRKEEEYLSEQGNEEDQQKGGDDLTLNETAFEVVFNDIINKDINELMNELSLPFAQFDSSLETPQEFTLKLDEQDNEIYKKFGEAFYKIAEEASIENWNKLTENLLLDSELGKLSNTDIKLYMNTKGVLIRFMFNLGGASLDNSSEIFKDATTSTLGDISFDMILTATLGEAAGPIGWGLVGLSVMDTLVYSPDMVKQWNESGLNNAREAQELFNNKEYIAALGLSRVAAGQFEAAGRAEALHQIAKIPDAFGKGIKYLWDKMTKDKVIAKPEKNSFFNPSRNESSKRESVQYPAGCSL